MARGLIGPGARASEVANLLRLPEGCQRIADAYVRPGDSPVKACARFFSSMVALGKTNWAGERFGYDGQSAWVDFYKNSFLELAEEVEKAGLAATDNLPLALPVGGHLFVGGLRLAEGECPLVSIPEELGEEARAVRATMQRFVAERVMPNTEALEGKDYHLMRQLLLELGQLGLLGAEIPEAYGGGDIDLATWTAFMEGTVGLDSFVVGITGHMGIGSQPIVKYGTGEQRTKYLPRMAAGELIGAYALTEPEAGSDAFGGMKTTAVEDGNDYVLNGSKRFITNAGFADVFIVFAKVGNAVTAFIVDKETPGFKIGKEEHKMGLIGSSTCELHFDNARIPRANLLGKVGDGQKIAMNILNGGRLRLGTLTAAQSVQVVGFMSQYAVVRKQFGQPIGNFGAVRRLIAQAAVKAFAAQSVAHRISGDMAYHMALIDPEDPDVGKKKMQIYEQFITEVAMAKVLGSETYNEVADTYVQVMGGYGFIEDYAAARYLRDARITRLFEGTSEINRLHPIVGSTLSRMRSRDFPHRDYSDEAVTARLRLADNEAKWYGSLKVAIRQANWAEELAGYTYDLVHRNQEVESFILRSGQKGAESAGQMLALHLADLAIGTYAVSSVVQRAVKLAEKHPDKEETRIAVLIAPLYARQKLGEMLVKAADLMATLRVRFPDAVGEGTILEREMTSPPFDTTAAEVEIAQHFLGQQR